MSPALGEVLVYVWWIYEIKVKTVNKSFFITPACHNYGIDG